MSIKNDAAISRLEKQVESMQAQIDEIKGDLLKAPRNNQKKAKNESK